MTRSISIAPVRKSIRVKASQEHAFEVFTSGLGRWWPRKMTIGNPPLKVVVMETRLGGRWYEESEHGSQTNVGKILVWEPPQRFVVSWDINSNWKPDTTVSSESRSGLSRMARTPLSSNWSIATSNAWEQRPAHLCARMLTAAGPASSKASSVKPRREGARAT
jgi:uncharacterized protein YndB with AHSA1/START domain